MNDTENTGEGIKSTSRIVEKIVEALGKGEIPWRKPWKSQAAYNVVSGKEYRGVNSLILNLASNYPDARFLTYKQAAALGGQVRKGEKGWPVIYYSTIKKDGEGEKNGETSTKPKTFRFMKHYTVFNASQVDGLPQLEVSAPVERFTPADQIVEGMPKRPTIGDGMRACYFPSLDRVEMPPRTSGWVSMEAYYSTLFHELTHATGHETRLKRDLEGMRYGKDGKYAREELVAEIGAHFLCQTARVTSIGTEENTIAYCQNWSRAIQSDPQAIFYAAAKAQAAHDYIMNIKKGDVS